MKKSITKALRATADTSESVRIRSNTVQGYYSKLRAEGFQVQRKRIDAKWSWAWVERVEPREDIARLADLYENENGRDKRAGSARKGGAA